MPRYDDRDDSYTRSRGEYGQSDYSNRPRKGRHEDDDADARPRHSHSGRELKTAYPECDGHDDTSRPKSSSTHHYEGRSHHWDAESRSSTREFQHERDALPLDTHKHARAAHGHHQDKSRRELTPELRIAARRDDTPEYERKPRYEDARPRNASVEFYRSNELAERDDEPRQSRVDRHARRTTSTAYADKVEVISRTTYDRLPEPPLKKPSRWDQKPGDVVTQRARSASISRSPTPSPTPLRAREGRRLHSPSPALPPARSSSPRPRRLSDAHKSSSSRYKRTYESDSSEESDSRSESEDNKKEKRHRSERSRSEKGKDREKDRHKEKKRKRKDREEKDERRSVLTGKKIKLKVHKDAADYERDKNRADLLQFLNSAY